MDQSFGLVSNIHEDIVAGKADDSSSDDAVGLEIANCIREKFIKGDILTKSQSQLLFELFLVKSKLLYQFFSVGRHKGNVKPD